jgi:conjugal transfer mating pair stabilization protein TraG
MWELYSIGDSAYLAAILNAIAMITGTGDFRQLAGLGFLIGVILVLFQGILQGARGIRFQNLLVAWVIYAVMFGPTTRVAIEDAYSGAVRVVDNVPLGPAAIGSLMSNVGYGVTRLFEQAFSTPAMTDSGFADALQALMSVRKGTLSRLTLGAANSPTPGADVERSFINYVADCTLYAVDIGARGIDDILRDPGWETALRADLSIPTTELVLGPNPELLPCDVAWNRLAQYTTVEFIPALTASLQAELRLAAPGDVLTKLQMALDALAGAGVDAQNYMVMTALVGFLEKGIVQTHEDLGQWALAATTEQATAQRNAQWAAEQTLLTRIVRPMMTFFEGFLFAIAPLMAFAIALGPAGIAMVGKYLLFGLWVQLWLPIMAVINLYLHMTIAGDLDALQNAGNLTLPSILSLYKLDFLLQDYLATGGMLAASTPAISLMLIYGSAITATHLAGRLQGGDHIDEKLTSPDVMRPAPALAMSPLMEHAPLRGTTTTGADNVLWRADVGQSVSRDLTSTRRAAEATTQAFSSGLASAAAASASRSGESFDARAMGWSYESSGSQTDRALLQEAEGLSRRYTESGLSSQQFAAALSTGLGVANRSDRAALTDAIKGALRAGGTLTGTYATNEQLQDQIADDIARRVTSDRELSARLAEGVKADFQSGARNVFTERLSSEERSTLERQASETLTAARSLERSESLAERFGTLGSYRAVEIGHAVAANPNLREQLYDRIDRLGLTGDHQRLAGSWSYAQVFADREQARAAAGMALLLGYGEGERELTADEQQRAREAGLGILADAFRAPGTSGITPHRNTDVEAAAPGPAGARAAVEGAGISDPRGATSGLRGEIAAHRGLTAERYDPTEVDRAHQRQRADTAAFGGEAGGGLRADKREHYAALLREAALLPRGYPQIAAEEVGGFLTKFVQSGALARAGVGGLANDGLTAVVSKFGETLLRTKDVGEALKAAGTGWSDARDRLIDTRLDQVRGYGLTDAQMTFFRAANESFFPAGIHDALGTESSRAREQARAALIAEEGPTGEHIAELLTRSAISQDDTYLRTIGAYNRSVTGVAPVSPPLSATSVTGGREGAVLDLIAGAESRGNYNAWYGNARQNEVVLADLSLDQVRALQGDLVRANGGSAIGRYQIIASTLDSLTGRLGLSGEERFTPALQDRLALQLAADAGMPAWLDGRLSDERFAENLARVWAGLPSDGTGASYYAGLQGNRATVAWDDVLSALRDIRRERDT